MPLSSTGLLNLRDPQAVRQRRPLLIAHRGAVGPDVPENTLASIHAAADASYDLVEVDVELTRDGMPVLFHQDRTGSMWTSCGVDASIRNLTSVELATVRYRMTQYGIPTLEEALDACTSHALGAVLDLKVSPAPPAIVRQIGSLLDRFGLCDTAMLLSEDPQAVAGLGQETIRIAPRADHQRVLDGEGVPLAGYFWPAFADRLQADEVTALRSNGALVMATVAPRLYPPHAHRALAGTDIARLRAAGVDAFLIDHEYRDLLDEEALSSSSSRH